VRHSVGFAVCERVDLPHSGPTVTTMWREPPPLPHPRPRPDGEVGQSGGPIRSLLRPQPVPPGEPGVMATPHLKTTALKVTRRAAALILVEDLRQLTRRMCWPNRPRRRNHWDQSLRTAVRPPAPLGCHLCWSTTNRRLRPRPWCSREHPELPATIQRVSRSRDSVVRRGPSPTEHSSRSIGPSNPAKTRPYRSC
jgi:hypothetical protein